MNDPDLNLMQERDWLKLTGTTQPVLQFREVRLLYRLEPGEGAEIRRVKLHPGVNVVWARPADPDEANPSARGRGHDVGKTSFCRLIRYLLGENHFGNEDLRSAIASSPKLNRAWVMGQIEIAQESWVVARPLYAGARLFATKGMTIEQTIELPASERLQYEDFVAAIESKVVKRFAVQTFDDEGNNPIRWVHVLQWLARDQEAHLAGLFKWRDPSSKSDSPEISADLSQFLARCVLDVTNAGELQEKERREKLTTAQKRIKENSRYYQRRIADALYRARTELPGGDELPDVGEALFVDSVVRHARLLVDQKRAVLQRELGKFDLPALESTLEQAIRTTTQAQTRYDDLLAQAKEIKDTLTRFKTNKKPTVEDMDALDSIIAKLKPDRAYCEIPIEMALFRCPLVQEKRLAVNGLEDQKNIEELATSKRDHVARQYEGVKRNLKQASAQRKKSQLAEAGARRTRDNAREFHTSLTTKMTGLDGESASWRVRAEDAELSQKRLDISRGALDRIESRVDSSKARQDQAQKTVRIRQAALAQVFLAVCHFFKGPEVAAELKFTRDEINARIGSGGGAYNALSTLSFDLTALIARLNGIGYHPCFLLHDSPRESDIEASLYRPLFQLAQILEQQAGTSFQYIITTTEPPPSTLPKSRICLELDAATPDGKLFRENL